MTVSVDWDANHQINKQKRSMSFILNLTKHRTLIIAAAIVSVLLDLYRCKRVNVILNYWFLVKACTEYNCVYFEQSVAVFK